MCIFGSQKAPAPVTPATPPPPPPVLTQDAPVSAAPKQGDKLNAGASGSKKYRNSLGISTAGEASASTGLGINL